MICLFYTGVPGQVVWMPAPQAPLGCPPGLEYLTTIDQVVVQQQIELLEGKIVMLGSLSNYDDNGNKNVTNLHTVFDNEHIRTHFANTFCKL